MSSASKGNDIVEQRGLVQSHAYTLIAAKKWEERNYSKRWKVCENGLS